MGTGFIARIVALFSAPAARATTTTRRAPAPKPRKPPGAGIDHITWQGLTKSYSDWSKVTGISETALRWRLQNGWPMDKAMTTPMRVVVRKGKKPQP